MKHNLGKIGIGAGLLLAGLAVTPSASAAEGVLDTSFGTSGKASVSFTTWDDVGRAVGVQKDGKIVIAGYTGNSNATTSMDFALVRYAKDGSLDSTFGSAGKVTTDFTNAARGVSLDKAYAMAIQSDGKIVAVGSAAGDVDFAVARYNTDGSLDTSFASGGKYTTYSLNSPTYYFSGGSATGVALQADGKIVVVGYIYNSPQHLSSNQYDFVVMRFNTSGTLDSSFGSGGVKVVAVGPGYDFDYARAVAIQSDGKIVIAGSSGPFGGGTDKLALVRLTSAGALDTGFGSGGKVAVDLGGKGDGANALVIQSDGKILAAGYTGVSPYGTNLAVVRFTSAGALDTSFGSSGKTTTSLGVSGNASAINGIAVQADGKIVVGGVMQVYYTVLARYTSSGVLDTTFANAGLMTTTSYDNIFGIALQSDGKIVAAGMVSTTDFGVARYLGTAGALSANAQADCIFAWAENASSAYFPSSGAVSGTALDYYYRYYSTGSYLATASRDNHVYYFGPVVPNTLVDLGTLAQWATDTGCQ